MVSVPELAGYRDRDDLAPRRPASIAGLDARLSVWGQAARDAVGRRADALVEGAVLYVARVGRNAEVLRPANLDEAGALLAHEHEPLVALGARLLPAAVATSCRLLWVDADRLRERFLDSLGPSLEAARLEVRRRQALYRRRARLWQNEQSRLDRLREEIEELRVPRCAEATAYAIAKGLLVRHREDAGLDEVFPDPEGFKVQVQLRVQAGALACWIQQMERSLGELGPRALVAV